MKGQGARDFFIHCFFVDWRSACADEKGEKKRDERGREVMEYRNPRLFLRGKRKPSRQRRR